jgi:hypothetical protein
MESDDLMEMAIKACLRQKTKPIEPVELIDDFEIGAADVKIPRLKWAIWVALGEDIRKGIFRLVKKKEIIYTEDKKLILTEVHDALKRGSVLKPVQTYE